MGVLYYLYNKTKNYLAIPGKKYCQKYDAYLSTDSDFPHLLVKHMFENQDCDFKITNDSSGPECDLDMEIDILDLTTGKVYLPGKIWRTDD